MSDDKNKSITFGEWINVDKGYWMSDFKAWFPLAEFNPVTAAEAAKKAFNSAKSAKAVDVEITLNLGWASGYPQKHTLGDVTIKTKAAK